MGADTGPVGRGCTAAPCAKRLVTEHGGASANPSSDIALVRDDLVSLRTPMGEAAANLAPFESAYAAVDWSACASVPMCTFANRMNAYNTYLLMEQEGLKGVQ